MLDAVQNYAFDGKNSTNNTGYNAVGSGEARLTPDRFAPGGERTPVDGPNARVVSNVVVAGNGTLAGPPYAGMMYAWRQFIDHDLDALTNDGVHHIDVAIPKGDPDFAASGVIPMTRTVVDDGGRTVKAVTGWRDASMVYGASAKTADSLRLPDGSMKTSDGNNLPIVNGMFAAGDDRAAENPTLTAVQTVMMREHNSWAGRLRSQHPDWSGDQVYQRARAIVT